MQEWSQAKNQGYLQDHIKSLQLFNRFYSQLDLLNNSIVRIVLILGNEPGKSKRGDSNQTEVRCSGTSDLYFISLKFILSFNCPAFRPYRRSSFPRMLGTLLLLSWSRRTFPLLHLHFPNAEYLAHLPSLAVLRTWPHWSHASMRSRAVSLRISIKTHCTLQCI